MESRIRDPVAGRIAAVTTTTTIETRKQRSSHTWSVGAIAFNIIYSSPRVLLRGHRLVAWWSALKVHILYPAPCWLLATSASMSYFNSRFSNWTAARNENRSRRRAVQG